MSSTQSGYYDDSYVFSYEQGFNIAIAFTAYDSETEPILDRSYGEIVFREYEWDFDKETGNSYVR